MGLADEISKERSQFARLIFSAVFAGAPIAQFT
jgi:hypothetical protein